ncbi:MAG: hypothetical protein LBR78_03100 [Holosporales bacterium]|jgi:hypothetical protein|nr:hypothetical protein [Holosporales bacterium]
MKKLVLMVVVVSMGISAGHCSEVAPFLPGAGDDASAVDIPGNSYGAQDYEVDEADIGAGCCGIGNISEFLDGLSAKLSAYRTHFASVVRCASELAAMLKEIRRVITTVTRHNSVDDIVPDEVRIADRDFQVRIHGTRERIANVIDEELSLYDDVLPSLPYGFPLGNQCIKPNETLTVAIQILGFVDRELRRCEVYDDTLQPLPYGFPLGNPYVDPDEKLAISMLQYIADVVDDAKVTD